MDHREGLMDFSLLGGPLHRLGIRLGLVRAGTNTVALGLALGAFLWAVLVALTLIEGLGDRVFSLSVVGGHVRLLVVIPLFFLCEAAVDPRATSFVRTIVASRVVPEVAWPQLETEIARSARASESWLPEATCLLAAALVTWIGPHLPLPGPSANYDPSLGAGAVTWTGAWYWIVCMTVFRFLLLRWLCRLGLWGWFLWRVSRLELHLVPTHPDGAGGVGYLEVVQLQFMPLVVAISALQSAMLAEDMSAGRMTLVGTYPGIALMLVVDAVLFLGPLCLFAPALWTSRIGGLTEYMELAARYVSEFDGKWIGAARAPREDLLGTADLQSLADLNNSVGIVRDMRWVPISTRTLLEFAVAALAPALPLLLFEYPFVELARSFVARVCGL